MKELEPKKGSWRSRIDDPSPVFHEVPLKVWVLELGSAVLIGVLFAWVTIFLLGYFGLLNWMKL